MACTVTVSSCNCKESTVAITTTHSITFNDYSNSSKLLGYLKDKFYSRGYTPLTLASELSKHLLIMKQICKRWMLWKMLSDGLHTMTKCALSVLHKGSLKSGFAGRITYKCPVLPHEFCFRQKEYFFPGFPDGWNNC